MVCSVPQIIIHYPRWNVRNVYKEKQKRDISQTWKTQSFFSTPDSIASCPFPLIPPSISLFSHYSHQPPLRSHPWWVSDTQGIVRVHVPLCTSRMLLPSGGIPSALDYVVRDRPQEGMGKILWAKWTHKHTHTDTRIYTHTVLEQICTTSQGKQSYAHIQNQVFSSEMDKSWLA